MRTIGTTSLQEDVGVPKNVHGKSTAQYPLLPRHESEEMTRAMEQYDTGDLEKAIYTAEVALAASLRYVRSCAHHPYSPLLAGTCLNMCTAPSLHRLQLTNSITI